jgi:hypothetical protein
LRKGLFRAGLAAWSRIGRGSRIALVCVAIVVIASRSRHEPEAHPAAIATPAPLSDAAMEEQALALQANGDYPAAEKLFRQCLAERQQMLGPTHIDTLAGMNNLANFTERARRKRRGTRAQ